MGNRMLRRWIEANRRYSHWQSHVVNRWTGRRSGREDFCHRILPALLRPGMRVLDVGGGKQPAIAEQDKHRLNLHVVGLDVSRAELEQAPPDAYDRLLVGDVVHADLQGPYDLIVSRTVLEHLADNQAAMANLARALAPAGVMAHFVPCRNALFARLNLMLGHTWSRRILFAIYPDKRRTQGFPAFYDHCSPRQMQDLCARHGLGSIEVRPYFQSEYFAFFAPLQFLELLRQVTLMAVGAANWCETFSLVARRAAAPATVVKAAA